MIFGHIYHSINLPTNWYLTFIFIVNFIICTILLLTTIYFNQLLRNEYLKIIFIKYLIVVKIRIFFLLKKIRFIHVWYIFVIQYSTINKVI